jgi:hypothetical protein
MNAVLSAVSMVAKLVAPDEAVLCPDRKRELVC